MKTLRAAVIGLNMGSGHARGYQEIAETELVALCDTDAEHLEKSAKEFGVSITATDYRELLDRDDIDIVSVATPDHVHAEQSIAFLAAGKHVMCEKPLTLDLEEAKAIIRASDESQAKFMIGQVSRFAPGFAKTQELIAAGEIGELYYIESEYAHSYEHARGVGDWRVDPRRHGIIGGGCHAVDLLRWIAGHPRRVYAVANHKNLTDWPVDDTTVAIYHFPNNVMGRLFCSIGCTRPYTMRSCFYGTRGTLVSDNTSPAIQVFRKGDDVAKGFTEIPVDVKSHNVTMEIKTFVKHLLEGTPVEMDAREGSRTVAACLAAVRSSRSGKPEEIADF